MQDQATRLRTLVSQTSAAVGGRSARQLVITGCKGGVGTTTLAVNLAIALRHKGQDVLLVDANPTRGDVATMCRLSGSADVDDVVDGREPIQQAITCGPADIRVLPRYGLRIDTPSASCRRLLRHLEQVSQNYSFVVIDAGSSPLAAEVLWMAATQAVVAVTPDYLSITNAYSLIKSMSRQGVLSTISLIVNKVDDEAQADDVSRRLIDSCARFLQLEVDVLAAVRRDDSLKTAEVNGRVLSCALPDSVASVAIARLADQLAKANVTTNDLKPLTVA